MAEMLLGVLETLFNPVYLLAIFGGVAIGMVFGAAPGLSGITALALLLPFTSEMSASIAVAMMVGITAIAYSTDSIPAILFGIPGSAAAQATILDGYPMTKKGEAHRALAGAFSASLVGGVLGTFLLGLSVPVLRPLVLSFGAPEFFMMGAMGLSVVAVLSAGNLLRGVLAAALGLMLSFVGWAPVTGWQRWTLGTDYLLDGIPIVPLVLGLFAIPETVEIFARGTRITSGGGEPVKAGLVETLRGAMRDLRQHWFLCLRGGLIGTWVGMIPGLGASVTDWLAYGHAYATERGASKSFGTGDIRGVMGPDSASNAKAAGELIPTLAFGVPGSGTMAIFLGALLMHNIMPGPQMLTERMDLTILIIWTVTIANLVGNTLLILATPYIARIPNLPPHYLVPAIYVLIAFAAYLSSSRIEDIFVLLAFGLLGWALKVSGWPRPPLILGFVLGPILEWYLFASNSRYGWTWLSHPSVILIALLIGITLIMGRRLTRFRKGEATSFTASRPAIPTAPEVAAEPPKSSPSPPGGRLARALFVLPRGAMPWAITTVFALALLTSRGWPPKSQFFPVIVASLALLVGIAELLRPRVPLLKKWFPAGRILDLSLDMGEDEAVAGRRAGQALSWFLSLSLAIWLCGFHLAGVSFLLLYLRLQARLRWRTVLLYTALVGLVVFGVFDRLLNVPWPDPFLLRLLGGG